MDILWTICIPLILLVLSPYLTLLRIPRHTSAKEDSVRGAAWHARRIKLRK